jgi:acyl-coenzyme A synthetase/AMP-(fatty) acid ligase
METMYFTFGVLTMIAMISIGAIVYGIMKVFKMEKQVKHLQEDTQWKFIDMNDRFRDYHQRIENVYTNAKDISSSYTDMRIDKLEEKLSGNSKKLIKG